MPASITNARIIRNRKKYLLKFIFVFVLSILISILAFLRYYNNSIDTILYRERQKQMKEVTSQLFENIEDITQFWWKDTDVLCASIEREEIITLDDLRYYMNVLADLHSIKKDHRELIAVDETGNYLSNNGWESTLTEMNHLIDLPDKVNFVNNTINGNDNGMFFLKKLNKPIEIVESNFTREIIYFGFICKTTELNPYFTCEAYNNSNSVYILDKFGSCIFKNGNENMFGYNAYNTLKNMEYLHNTSFEIAKEELEEKGLSYSNVFYNEQEYYYALKKMDNAEWIILFIVPSLYVAQEVISLVETTATLILVFTVSLSLISILAISFILYRTQKRTLTIERNINDKLTIVNDELDKKNIALSEAARLADIATSEAIAASKAKSDFLANMSHDIRTPMNVIVGITGLMGKEKNLSEKMIDYINKVNVSSHHLLGLLNDILDMTRIEANRVNIISESIKLVDQIEQLDTIIRPQAIEKQQNFKVIVHNVVHQFYLSDGVHLRQVLLNILSNAVKYTQRGGTITMDITELDSDIFGMAKLSFVVTDNGYGMSKEFLEHIFEPFVRSENSITNKIQGTGLGMSIAKSIVDLMGGTINIESELGKGSRFEVILTVPIDNDIQCIIDIENILVITDDTLLIDNVMAMVEKTDINVFTTDDVKKSKSTFENQRIDVVLLSGYLYNDNLQEIVDSLRDYANDNVLIFCTDYVENNRKEQIEYGGADGLIMRPLFLSRLADAIKQARNSSLISGKSSESILKGMKFLCAEDNELNAEILTAILDMYGATCEVYENGEELVNAFSNVQPGQYDAILMDVQMPIMNGLEATKAIRSGKNLLGRTIPIIAMTANAFAEDIQKCFDAGMTAHVPKPINIIALEKVLIKERNKTKKVY